jgi:hypothetical protein
MNLLDTVMKSITIAAEVNILRGYFKTIITLIPKLGLLQRETKE